MAAGELILTVIIPVYNESATITKVLDAVAVAPYPKQMILVDDGSTDDTIDVIGRWMDVSAAARMVRICRHPVNRGKGAAIRTGLTHAEGRIVVIQDADLECDPADYPILIGPILDGSADVVFGSRYLGAGAEHPWNAGRVFVALANVLVRLLYGRRISDEAGCYKVMRTELLRTLDLRCTRFEFCPEVVAKVCRMGLLTREVPVRYRPRTRRDGKKIGWRDAAEAIFTLFRWRFATIPKLECTDPTRLRHPERNEIGLINSHTTTTQPRESDS
jgi:glycosyltransferase involved in cell wall biosynthesis